MRSIDRAWPAMPNGGAGVETEERVPRRLPLDVLQGDWWVLGWPCESW